MMNDDAKIQVQDTTGNWQTHSVVVNNAQRVSFEMRSIASRYPNSRVRAVDKSERIIDNL